MVLQKVICLINRGGRSNGYQNGLSVVIENPKLQAPLLKKLFKTATISDITRSENLEDLHLSKIRQHHPFYLDVGAIPVSKAIDALPTQFRINYDHIVNDLYDRTVDEIATATSRQISMMNRKDFKRIMLNHDNVNFSNNEPLHSVIETAFHDAARHSDYVDFGSELKSFHCEAHTPHNVYSKVLNIPEYPQKADSIHNDLLRNIKTDVYNKVNEYSAKFGHYAEREEPVPFEEVLHHYKDIVKESVQNTFGAAAGKEWFKKNKCSTKKHPSQTFMAAKVSLVKKNLPHGLQCEDFAHEKTKVDPWGDAKDMSEDLQEFSKKFERKRKHGEKLVVIFPHKKKSTKIRGPMYSVVGGEDFDAKAKMFHIWDDDNNKHTYSFGKGKMEVTTGEETKVSDEHDWDHYQVSQNIHLFHHKYN